MRKFIFILCVLSCTETFAQWQISLPKTGNQQMIEKSIFQSIFLIRQEYQIKDTLTQQRFTLDHRLDFGSAVSFAVLTESGYIVSNDIIAPWEKDSEYEAYRASQYRPVLSRTLMRTVKDTTWRESALISPQSVFPMKDSLWLEVKDSLYAEGLSVDYSEGEKNGWVVWLTSGKENTDSSALSLATYRQTLEFSDKADDDIMIKAPNANFTVLGGVYINPCFERIGQITFNLCGIIVKKEDSWTLLRCVSGQSPKDTAEETVEAKTAVLTPLESEQEIVEDVSDEGVPVPLGKKGKEKKEKHNKKKRK